MRSRIKPNGNISATHECSVICGPIGCTVDFVCRLLHLKIISLKKPLQIGLCNKAIINYLTAQFLLPYILSSKMGLNRICIIINNKFKICATNLIKFMLYYTIVMIKICLFLIKQACLKAKVRNTEQDFFNHYINFSVKNSID